MMRFNKIHVFAMCLLVATTKGESGMRGVAMFSPKEVRQLQGSSIPVIGAPAAEGSTEEHKKPYYDEDPYYGWSSSSMDEAYTDGGTSSSLGSTATGSSGESTNTNGSTSGSSDSGGTSECACRRYLVDDYLWHKVEQILVFPDFCCFLSVMAYFANYEKGNRGNKLTEKMVEKEAIDRFLDNMVGVSAVNKNVREVELVMEIDSAFSEEGIPEYGFDPGWGKCVGKTGVHLLKCLLLEKLDEGIDACYCEYRGNLGCSYSENCDKDVYFDVAIASKTDPFFSCFQCPKAYNYDSSAGKNDVIYGKPYNPCLGYCFLAGSYHDSC